MSLIKESELPPPPPILPPPPLPLFLPPVQNNSKLKPETNISKEEELNQALKRLLNFNEDFNSIFYYTYLYLEPQLQVGPKCGLVALSMATSTTQNFVNVDSILDEAHLRGFSKQGEMFDVNHLASLATNLCGFSSRVIEGGLDKHVKCIIQNLLNKDLLLIPYDADHNHGPCCKKGYKAHWAVISGFVIIQESDNECTDNEDNQTVEFRTSYNLCDCVSEKLNSECKKLTCFTDSPGKLVISKKWDGIDTNKHFRKGKLYLIGRQGKSRHLGIWSFDEMSESNNNLIFFSPSRDFESYIVPEGGPAEGLRGKAIILSTV